MKRIATIMIAMIAIAGMGAVSAQEASLDDIYFGADQGILSSDESGDAIAEAAAGPSVRIGGSMTMSSSVGVDPSALDGGFEWLEGVSADLALGTRIFIDARPTDSTRFFIKGEANAPFAMAEDFGIREIFADLTIDDAVFLRLGKQTVNWGVGYWYSPANVINLGNKDPEDPDAELTGPIAIKAQVPASSDNYYMYVILQDMDAKKTIGVAGKAEWVLGGAELSLGGIYRPGQPWAITTTLTGRAWDFDLYAEGVLKGQDDRMFVVEDSGEPLGIGTETRSDRLQASATAGFSWSWNDDGEWINLRLGGQYFWNGAGYEDQTIFADYKEGIGAALAAGELKISDLYQRGRHYAAASVMLSDLFKSDIGLSGAWLANLQDRSGKIISSISWSGIDKVKLSIQYSWSYGAEGSDYSPMGAMQSMGVGLDLIGVNF